jgi:hypothetical protein
MHIPPLACHIRLDRRPHLQTEAVHAATHSPGAASDRTGERADMTSFFRCWPGVLYEFNFGVFCLFVFGGYGFSAWEVQFHWRKEV